MSQTVVGVYDSDNEAQQAAQAVIASGIDRNRVRVSAKSASGATGDDKGFWDSLKDAFGFGDEDSYGYSEAYRRGGSVVTVNAADHEVNAVADILQRYNPANIDERAETWRKEGWAGYDRYAASRRGTATTAATTQAATTGTQQTTGKSQAIPVVNEELHVGKEIVSRGGVRIHTHVTQQPVEKKVTLREEHVNVDRRAVDRPLSGAEANAAFKDQTIEARERIEEPVVRKEARVTEEVRLGKEATEHTETVRDSVRKTNVDVERLDKTDKVTDKTDRR